MNPVCTGGSSSSCGFIWCYEEEIGTGRWCQETQREENKSIQEEDSGKQPCPPPSDDQVFWLHFSELCRYKAEHGTKTVPRSKHGMNNVLANWVHYISKRYASNLLADKYKNSLNGINCEWTAGQITKKGFEGWFAELVEYQKQNGTVEVLGDNKKKNPQLANWGNYARRTAIAVLTNKKKMQSLPCYDVRCLSTVC
jgi:hypothetical protein